MVVLSVPYLWVLTVDWNGSASLFRTAISSGYTENIYDLQARAMMAGRLYVPPGSLGLESWIHNGHAYTYFGVFPSLIRIPGFLMTGSLDGRLTAISLLCSWTVTGLFTALLLWRVRIMLRPGAGLGWSEAVASAFVVASVLAGSVLMFLASTPFVFSEDKAWGVALSIGAFFALLGVIERPSWGRVAASGALVTMISLTRLTGALACILGAILVALWFAWDRRSRTHRRWAVSMAAVAVGAGVLASIVNWLKFGTVAGLPLQDYTAFHYLHESAINGGRYFALLYFPTDVLAYLTPTGIHLSRLFPYITLPEGPPVAVGGVHFDNIGRTTSVTASMPLLVLLGGVGIVGVCRRGRGKAVAALRLLLAASFVGAGAVLFYGWIADRYLSDFLPFLAFSAVTGVVLIWRWLDHRQQWMRRCALAIVAILGAFGVVANIGIAIAPSQYWNASQDQHFLAFQNWVVSRSGLPSGSNVRHGDVLPQWAPAGTVFIAGPCDALYLSNGEDFSFVPSQKAEHYSWMLVEAGSGFAHDLRVSLGPPTEASRAGVPLVKIGRSTVLMHSAPAKGNAVKFWFNLDDPSHATVGTVLTVPKGSFEDVSLFTDRFAGIVTVSLNGFPVLDGPMSAGGPVLVDPHAGSTSGSFSVSSVPRPVGAMSLCHRLERAPR